MTVTANQVKEAFYVSGSEVSLTYQQFITYGYQDIEMIVSSSATDFFIKLYPTASSQLSFRTEDNKLVNQGRPIILPPISESVTDNTTKIYARLDTSAFNTFVEETIDFPIKFNLTGLEYVLTYPSTTTTTTTLAPAGSTTTTTTSTTTTTTTSTTQPPDGCFQTGNICTTDSECCSGICYNPNGTTYSGTCVDYIPPGGTTEGNNPTNLPVE